MGELRGLGQGKVGRGRRDRLAGRNGSRQGHIECGIPGSIGRDVGEAQVALALSRTRWIPCGAGEKLDAIGADQRQTVIGTRDDHGRRALDHGAGHKRRILEIIGAGIAIARVVRRDAVRGINLGQGGNQIDAQSPVVRDGVLRNPDTDTRGVNGDT